MTLAELRKEASSSMSVRSASMVCASSQEVGKEKLRAIQAELHTQNKHSGTEKLGKPKSNKHEAQTQSKSNNKNRNKE